MAEALARVSGTSVLDDLADVDLVVEAVVEEIGVKTALFANLDEICKPGAVLATTTSSLPVVEMAAVTSRPADVVGMHFFNPAAIMRLVEIVAHVSTAPDVIATAAEVCKKTGKHAVHCGDRAGFIVNALLFPYLNDAVRMLEAHYATADEIDVAMKKGCGLPMGPFELLDVVGNDVSLAIQQTLYREFREPGFAPAPMLEHLVTAGYLGRKTGRGFRVLREVGARAIAGAPAVIGRGTLRPAWCVRLRVRPRGPSARTGARRSSAPSAPATWWAGVRPWARSPSRSRRGRCGRRSHRPTGAWRPGPR